MKLGVLRAKVTKVLPQKYAKNGYCYIPLCLSVQEDGKHWGQIFINCFDTAYYKCLNGIEVDDYIEAYPHLCAYEDRQGNLKLSYKLTDFKKISKPEKLGLYAEDSGVVGSLDVHVASGKNQKYISVSSGNIKTTQNKDVKTNKSYLKLLQDSYILDLINKNDKVSYSGYLDLTSTDRIIFKEIVNIQKELSCAN